MVRERSGSYRPRLRPPGTQISVRPASGIQVCVTNLLPQSCAPSVHGARSYRRKNHNFHELRSMSQIGWLCTISCQSTAAAHVADEGADRATGTRIVTMILAKVTLDKAREIVLVSLCWRLVQLFLPASQHGAKRLDDKVASGSVCRSRRASVGLLSSGRRC
jgi:hypothetical protein